MTLALKRRQTKYRKQPYMTANNELMKDIDPSKNTLMFTSENGTPFNVRIVYKGDRYGRAWCLIHDKDDPLVEFYCTQYGMHTIFGNYVQRYYKSTLTEEKQSIGINIGWGYEPEWIIDAAAMDLVRAWLINPIVTTEILKATGAMGLNVVDRLAALSESKKEEVIAIQLPLLELE